MGKTTATPPKIEVGESGIRLRDLEIPRRSVAEYLRGLPEEDQELAFVEAVEVGVFCLERASGARDLDFVRRQVDSLLATVDQAVSAIPQAVQAGLLGKIGTDDGQVLSPVQRSVESVSQALGERVTEVREILSEKIDPDKRSSVLGRALGRIGDLLDPARADSVQAVITKAVESVSRQDGSLAACVRETVAEAVKPLGDEVNRLAKQMAADEAAQEALQGTTKKGASFEEQVVADLQVWAGGSGASISHVGTDNRPGDILIEFASDGVVGAAPTIVVEARDRASRAGRKAIADTMDKAMAERSANAGIYLSRSLQGLGIEIGGWGEGASSRGPWVATTPENLRVAIRLLVVQHRLSAVRDAASQVDRPAMETQIERIRTALRRIGTINRAASAIRDQAGTVHDEAEKLRREVRDALVSIEDGLRVVSEAASAA